MEVIKNRVYRHFKGDYYIVVDICRHSETLEEMVLYRGLYGEGPLWARPISEFDKKVNKEKYPDVTQEYCFELQEIESVRKG